MNIDTNVWGTETAEFDTINARTGATDLNDPDYTNYPPFTKNNLCAGGTNPSGGTLSDSCLYMGLINRPQYFDFETDFNTSICYCACNNPDLLICSYAAPMPAITDENTGAVTMPFKHMVNRSGPFPIALLDNYDYCVGKTNHTGNNNLIGNIHTPYYNPTSQIPKSYFEYVPNGINNGNYDTSTNRNASNNNLFFSYWRDFGLRSLFCVIYVVYFDGTYNATTGQPTNISDHKTLHWYETQTDEWKSSHPLLAAFGRPFLRRNVNGTYSSERSTNHVIIPDFSRFTIDYNPEHHDVWQPCVASSGTTPENCFPIFGGYRTGFANSSGANAVAQFVTQLSTGGLCNQADIILGHGCRGVNENSGLANNSVGRRTFWLEMDGTAENLELIRKSMAGYGLFFADDVYDLADAGRDDDRWTDENMCLGIIDDNGYTDGTYTRGTGNENANNFLWKTVSESKYDPSRPPPVGPDPTIYSDETCFNILGGVANCNKVYAVNASNIMNLAKALSTAITTRLSDLPPLDYSIETFLTNNPLDCVVSLRKYPVTNLSSGTEVPIAFGSYENANVQGIPFVKSYELITFTFSNAARNSLYAHFGDFRDYEPYTHAELIVPFCGTVQINPCDFIGHDINVYMVIDYITGGCTAYVAADKLVVTSIAGTIGVDVPLSGIQTATLESQRVNAVMSRKSADIGVNNAIVGGLSSSVGLLASAGAGNVLGAVGSGAGLVSSVGRIEQSDIAYQKADYELKHQQVPFKQVSAGTPIASTVIENCCRLIIYRPVLDDRYNAEVYAKTVGFACLMNGKVSNFSGYTVGNINVDGLAITDTEKQAIQKAFANGVIL